MTAIIDYGVGNLFSLLSSLEYLGFEAKVTSSAEELEKADRLILPGVGAFGDARKMLDSTGLVPVIKRLVSGGKPLLGICLGMQLLFEKSFEYGEHEGLGLIKGEIRPLEPDIKALGLSLKTPQMGWNSLDFVRPENKLLKYIKNGDFVYFVHSYYAVDCEASLVARVQYGVNVPAAVACENVYGCQFHPEKSGETGLKILRAFCE
ncbi:MAG: imidazole glycerol phosphate synthase subunit HisH [Clostridiales bacterium]|nr:imidazole glycerol phosphate synthase subunit HisH [Clostridiales bacterium]